MTLVGWNSARNLARVAGYFVVDIAFRESGKESGNHCRIRRDQQGERGHLAKPIDLQGARR